jgi:hypothetical protein
LWYAPIHETFTYDVGLWVFWAPYVLFNVTVYADKWLPATGTLSSYRPAFYMYGIGVGLIIYRFLFGYFKWAFPVNVLADNRDCAFTHRAVFATIVIGLAGKLMAHFFGF